MGNELTEALLKACAEADASAVASLLEAGADPESTDAFGRSALEVCVEYGNDLTAETTRVLLQHGADPNRRLNGWTVLIEAALLGEPEVVAALIEAGADVNAQTETGTTALHMAAANWRTEIVRQLLCAGADPSIRNNEGDTAVDGAVQQLTTPIPEIPLSERQLVLSWLLKPATVPCVGGDKPESG